MHPFNDKIKVRVAKDEYGFGGSNQDREHGVVVEVPDNIFYIGFHSFAFENSLFNSEIMNYLNYFKDLIGKTVYWEALQDRGRRFTEGDSVYVILNMTDVIGYEDDDKVSAQIIDDVKSGGFQVGAAR